jgi:predicted DsbA family dithiol-disulfide isomerase
MTIGVAPGTIAFYGDIACPWATIAVVRLVEARRKAGLEGALVVDHRAFPLEIVNERPTPFRTLRAEHDVAVEHEPSFGWRPWSAPESTWPVTTLLALEAVEAAKEQSAAASEQLDLALRRALFVESRCISLRHVILDVAAGCGAVDADALREALDDGRARRDLLDGWFAAADDLQGSPHLFFADGFDVANPGIELHWEGEGDAKHPVVDADDPAVYDDLVRRALAGLPARAVS